MEAGRRNAPRGGLSRERLEPLVAAGLSQRAIAARLDVSQATVRHWLKRHGLQTSGRRGRSVEARTEQRVCERHGLTEFVAYTSGDVWRCTRCRKERVSERRRTIKRILVEEAGGRCALCGYDRYVGALQFHHRDPATKSFGLAFQGAARSLERCREEARKCVLLCANCHAEVEAGVATISSAPGISGSSVAG